MAEDIDLGDHTGSDDIDEMLDDFDVYDTERQLAFESLIGRLRRPWFHPQRARAHEQDLIAAVSAGTGFMVQEAARLGAAGYSYGFNPHTKSWQFYSALDDDDPITKLGIAEWAVAKLSERGVTTIGQLVELDWYELMRIVGDYTQSAIQEQLGAVCRQLAPQPPMGFPC